MKALVAIDSFKGCISSFEANASTEKALLEYGFPESVLSLFPVSDGGEGFCKVLSHYLPNAVEIPVAVHAPAGNIIMATYLWDDCTVYVESASSCGYNLVDDAFRNPLLTSSLGLGEMIKDAIRKGATRIIVGLGGTAVCDGGIGLLQGLGVSVFTDNGILKPGVPAMLKHITGIDLSPLKSIHCQFEAWTDTNATFSGSNGAVRIFGRQKGISAEWADDAERWMESLLPMLGLDNEMYAAGAAGGIGGTLLGPLDADLKSGAEMILEFSGMIDSFKAAGDEKVLVITGEGRYDTQTLTGKLPYIVANAAKHNCGHAEVVCIAGKVETDCCGPFDDVIQVTPDRMPFEESMKPDVASQNIQSSLKRFLLLNENGQPFSRPFPK